MMTRLRLQAMAAAMAMAFTLSGILPVASQTTTTQTAAAPAAANPAIAAPEKERKAAPAPRAGGGSGHVYLLRGLLNIFSLGMDDLAAKLQARGVAATVHNHAEWQSLADEIAARYKAGKHGPIVLIGHSLGADAVMIQADYLGKKGVPVALVVPFDGTGSYAASSNVSRVMNLTQRDYAYMKRGSGFRGELQNIDVSKDGSIDHINIDKSGRLHNMVVGKVLGVLGRGGGAPKPKPDTNTSVSAQSTSGSAPTAAASPAPAAATSQAPSAAAAPNAQ
jgi:pyruvate/2-oxoglutarate dehydrogenase complex dihydrolipoamide acyltransferase (E2) component